MSLESLSRSLRGPSRKTEYFDTERQANERLFDLKAEGKGNPRKSAYHDHTRNGVKVYKYTVSYNG